VIITSQLFRLVRKVVYPLYGVRAPTTKSLSCDTQ
jgi:hypothetical protein